MPTEAATAKPKPLKLSGASSPAPPSPSAVQQKPPVQANPWGFFLPDDIPDQVTPPAKDGSEDALLSIKPLRIVKTGPASSSSEGEAEQESGAQPVGAASQPVLPEHSPDVGTGPTEQQGSTSSSPVGAGLAPAPLNLARPQPPAIHQQPATTGGSPVIIPPAGTYPLPPASPVLIPPAGTYPPQSPVSPVSGYQPSPGVQMTLPLHPYPTGGSSTGPASLANSVVVTPLTPAQTGHPTYTQAPSQHAYTQPTPASPVYVQAGLPPTLPMNSYFPQQPSYARPEPASTASAHHSPAASVSSTAQEAAQIAQHLTSQEQYASPPPSYDQAVAQTASPAAAPLSPHPTAASSMASYPFSPADIGGPRPFQQTPSPPNPQAHPHAPPIPQPSYVNGPQSYQANPPPALPPRTSPPAAGAGRAQHPSAYPPPPTRPGYVAPPLGPVKSNPGLFSSATARKLLNKTTDFVDQAITPYLQESRYRPPYGHYQYPHQYHQYPGYQYPPSHPAHPPPGQYYQPQPGYAPTQRT
ncbi:hypothetical protein CPLU01_08958 [Colletotrichum plurivorum]|uniref:Uncharacterized protein n=1 Tax=Colletotrichum plurivorum TaxID=2175906 RepID=A0A8H6KAC9_9PEZI|nr:hypothetical protein CPLU01_08958 [Colletotrichum plurivorum]